MACNEGLAPPLNANRSHLSVAWRRAVSALRRRAVSWASLSLVMLSSDAISSAFCLSSATCKRDRGRRSRIG